MSKTIDTSAGYGGLSEDDLKYLAQRDDLDAAAELISRGGDVDQSAEVPIDQVANTGNANTAGETIADLEARLERMRAEQAVEEDEDDEDRLGPDDYASASNDMLRTEIVKRNEERENDEDFEPLSIDGKKADLIATLEADDAENAED